MKRTFFAVVTAAVLLTQSVSLVDALTLDNIGTATVTGNINTFSYIGTNPVFRGTTDPSASVSVALQGATQSVTADGSGNWTYSPTNLLSAGSYPVTINSGSESMSFTLNLSTTTESATTDTIFSSTSTTSSSTTSTSTTSGQPILPEELPQTGTAQETMLLLAGGLGLITGGVLFYWKVVPKLLFEEASDSVDTLDNHLR